MNLPNKLTLLRICLIPVFVILMLSQVSNFFLISCIIFIIASITDFLDGKIARKYNLVTDFGKFMDPLADKLLELLFNIYDFLNLVGLQICVFYS